MRGDGHCLLYSISESLKEDTFVNMSCDELCVKLWNEVNDNKQYYPTSLSGDTDILEGNDKCIAENNIMQIALTLFCCSRSRSYPHCLTRDGAGVHYNAVNVQPEEETT